MCRADGAIVQFQSSVSTDGLVCVLFLCGHIEAEVHLDDLQFSRSVFKFPVSRRHFPRSTLSLLADAVESCLHG